MRSAFSLGALKESVVGSWGLAVLVLIRSTRVSIFFEVAKAVMLQQQPIEAS